MLVPSLCVGSRPRTHQHPAPPRRDTGPWHLHGQPSFEVHSSGQTRPWCVLLASPRAPPLPAPQGSHCHCRICYSDTSSPQEDQYPPNIAVKVNHSYCSVPVSGVPGQPWLCFVGGGGRAAWREGQGHRPPCSAELRLLPGLLPLEQARRGAQEALPPHQPHPPHVPVLGHQPHHRHLGELWQGEWGGPCPVAHPFPPQHPLHPLARPDAPSPSAPRVTRWPCTWCGS